MKFWLFFGLVGAMQGSQIWYTDQAQWNQAVLSIPGVFTVEEKFTDDVISTPGLSFESTAGMAGNYIAGNGHMSFQEWVDCVGKDGCGLPYDLTEIHYGSGLVYGIYGDWYGDLAVGPNDSGIMTQISNNCFGSAQLFSGRCGFVSDVPFQDIGFWTDSGAARFALDNLWIADPEIPNAPEPATFALVGVFFFGLGLFRFFRFRAPIRTVMRSRIAVE